MDSEKRIERRINNSEEIQDTQDLNKIFNAIQAKLAEDLKKNHEEAFISVKQKLWSLDWYFKVIQEFNPAHDAIMTDPGVVSPIATQNVGQTQLTTSSGTVTIINPILSEKDKLFLISLLFDGFTWNAKSILDCFAHEAIFIYSMGGYSQKRKLHIDDLPKLLENNHKKRNFTQLLDRVKKEDWYRQLNKFRDTTTHRNVIPKEIEYTTTERTNFLSNIPKIKTREGKIFIKKDPDDEKSEEIDLKNFTVTVDNKIKKLIEDSYQAIFKDIKSKRKLPLTN